ncbi:hypothetical protein SAMN06265337_1898 [Hymenobacter gelipurpurascens]|uniref:Uncharacterized protein n=1 Tax=Hymenobacter gelipurpurascens TaxID=89968 RepID=A0A212TMU0_9BACT|nr:hypothetical protein [Hymenobacter gelipurpurascens]SNC67283.1 hypothetical protein SAMN06265337_1898 [Hymenobacter gelipurpurascens]
MPSWLVQFGPYFDLIAGCSMLIPTGMAWSRRAYLTGGLRPLAILPGFLFASYWLMQLGIYLWHYNIAIAHLNTVVESLILIQVYHDNAKKLKQRQVIRWLMFAFACFALADSFFIEGFDQINSYTNLFESILVSVLILAYFEESVFIHHKDNLFKIPLFIASIGVLLYLAGTVMLYLFSEYLIKINDLHTYRAFYSFNSFLFFVLAMLLTRAFYLVKPPQPKILEQKWGARVA